MQAAVHREIKKIPRSCAFAPRLMDMTAERLINTPMQIPILEKSALIRWSANILILHPGRMHPICSPSPGP